MVEELKNVLLAGLGSAAYTYEKSKKIVDEMVVKGKLTLEEGKQLSEELKRNIKDVEVKVKPLTKADMAELLKEMNFASKDDLEEIKTRLTKLENSKSE
jgi:polyhydroxyalkanoate synthesis regulator phasin